MSDRLTQLQDAVNQLARHMCDSVGILQGIAPQGHFSGMGSDRSTPKNEEKLQETQCQEHIHNYR